MPNDAAIAASSHGLTHGGMVTSEPSSEIALSALNISIVTRTDSDSVDALTFPSVKYLHGLCFSVSNSPMTPSPLKSKSSGLKSVHSLACLPLPAMPASQESQCVSCSQ